MGIPSELSFPSLCPIPAISDGTDCRPHWSVATYQEVIPNRNALPGKHWQICIPRLRSVKRENIDVIMALPSANAQ
jgi:hypothetical protein